MKAGKNQFNKKQLIYQEIVIGTLIYAVVLGFLNDYTDIVEAKSFSTIFFASAVLEVLTFLTFQLKNHVVAWLKKNDTALNKILILFSVWFIMFMSKFVFIWILDIIFSSYIAINGFFGILLVVILVTVIHKLAYVLFAKLSDAKP